MLVVDTFNVLHAAKKVDPRLVGMRIDDLRELISMSRFVGEPVVLVVDGTGGGRAKADAWGGWSGSTHERGGHVRFLYAGVGKDADTVIELFLDERERAGRGRATTVVSNDKRVLAAAVGVRAKTMTSDEFLGHLVLDAGKTMRKSAAKSGDRPAFASGDGLDPAEAIFWLREFGEAPPDPRSSVARTNTTAPPELDAATLEEINQWALQMDLDEKKRTDIPQRP